MKTNLPQIFCPLVNGACALQNNSMPTIQQEGEEHLLQGCKLSFVSITPYYSE